MGKFHSFLNLGKNFSTLQKKKFECFYRLAFGLNWSFSASDLTNFLNDIEELKKGLGEGSFLRCFGDWKRIPEATQTEIRQFLI